MTLLDKYLGKVENLILQISNSIFGEIGWGNPPKLPTEAVHSNPGAGRRTEPKPVQPDLEAVPATWNRFWIDR